MKVALVGSSGYIAGFLLERFKTEKSIEMVLKVDQTEDADEYLNLLRPEEFDYSLLESIDYVIFLAAISEPDKCASDFDICWSINVTGTEYFIGKAIEHRCKVLFFSSDAVFGDISGCIYTEASETQAYTPYGRMKKAVEDAFKESFYFKTIRLSYVASAKDRFITYCLICIKNAEVAEVFHPFYRNCIVVSDVVNVVMWFVENWDRYSPLALNVAGKELVSRIRIADELNRNLGNRLKYKIIKPDKEFYQNRSKITQMVSIYIQEYDILKDNTFTEKIKIELEHFII